MKIKNLKELLLKNQGLKSANYFYNVKKRPIPYSAKEIYDAWSVPPGSGFFSEFGPGRLPFQVSWILQNYPKCCYKGINFASSFIDCLRNIEQTTNGTTSFQILAAINFYKRLFFENRKRPAFSPIKSLKDEVDILPIIEYCSNKDDLFYFEIFEKTNPGLYIDYWVTSPVIRSLITKNHAFLSDTTISHLLANQQSILELYPWNESVPSASSIFESSYYPLKKLSRFYSQSVWKYHSSLATTIIDACFLLFSLRKPRTVLIMDDQKMIGNIAAKVARSLNIPTILIPHAGGGGAAHFPTTCDFVTAWGEQLILIMKDFGLSENRIWKIGDICGGNVKELSDKNEKIRGKFGLTGKIIIGYFASTADLGELGLQALIKLYSRLGSCAIVVRPHPRNYHYFYYLRKKYKNTPIIIIPETELTLEQFCSITDIVIGFDTTALCYGVRFGNLGIQVNLIKGYKPETDCPRLLDLPVALSEAELFDLVEKMVNPETKQEFIERRRKAIPKLWEASGIEAANLFFNHIKSLCRI